MVQVGPGELGVLLCIGTFICAVVVLPFWKISSKAGFPGWFSLAMLFPILNIIFIFFLAFADWPALRNASSAGTRQG